MEKRIDSWRVDRAVLGGITVGVDVYIDKYSEKMAELKKLADKMVEELDAGIKQNNIKTEQLIRDLVTMYKLVYEMYRELGWLLDEITDKLKYIAYHML